MSKGVKEHQDCMMGISDRQLYILRSRQPRPPKSNLLHGYISCVLAKTSDIVHFIQCTITSCTPTIIQPQELSIHGSKNASPGVDKQLFTLESRWRCAQGC